jgi:membrane protein YdbS with pleckstrin-like domain
MKALLLALLRVPERPSLPPGPVGSVDCFRASRRFLGYMVLKWSLKQVGAVISLVISLAFLGGLSWGPFGDVEPMRRLADKDVSLGFLNFSVDMTMADLLGLVEMFAIGAFLVQLVVSGFFLKLAWELRWYMVSDTTIRIREGLLRLKEQTMTVANIQNLSIRQGPLQRVFGIYDLEVETAGGAGSGNAGDPTKSSENLHVGRFRGLRDAEALRRRLRAQLALHKDAGLGDPDEPGKGRAAAPASKSAQQDFAQAAAAASQLLVETRALRGVLVRSATPG